MDDTSEELIPKIDSSATADDDENNFEEGEGENIQLEFSDPLLTDYVIKYLESNEEKSIKIVENPQKENLSGKERRSVDVPATTLDYDCLVKIGELVLAGNYEPVYGTSVFISKQHKSNSSSQISAEEEDSLIKTSTKKLILHRVVVKAL